MRKHERLIILFLILAVLSASGVAAWRDYNKPSSNSLTAYQVNKKSTSLSNKNDPTKTTPEFNKSTYSTSQASSIWVVVNKGRILPSSYAPANLVTPNVPLRLSSSSSEMHLRQDAATALEGLVTAAKGQGLNLMLASGYRSYSQQLAVYNSYVSQIGQAQSDRSSARPGHSEHQTGLAADLEPSSHSCEVQDCFATTPEGRWLAVNAYRYGFIIRYQAGKESLTGYEYEPWHVRYLGLALAEQVNNSGQTLEQYFGLPTYTSYPATSVNL